MSWAEVEACIAESRLSLVVGSTDTGKSTLVAQWASMLCREGKRCVVVDADVGQSDIGPAGTIGIGYMRNPIDRLSDIEAGSLYFVGSFSPRNRVLECLVGVKRLVDRARREQVDHILVDTTGFLQGSLGRAFKLHKVEILEPDLVICLEREMECRFLARAFRRRQLPRVVLLNPPVGARTRSYTARYSNRLRSLRMHFKGANVNPVDLRTVGLFNWPAGEEEVLTALGREELEYRLVGVEDLQGMIQGLGVIERLVSPGLTAYIWMPPSVKEIGALRFGEVRFDREEWQVIRDGAS